MENTSSAEGASDELVLHGSMLRADSIFRFFFYPFFCELRWSRTKLMTASSLRHGNSLSEERDEIVSQSLHLDHDKKYREDMTKGCACPCVRAH